MNISYKWLKKYLQSSHSAEELAVILTSIGLEVGGVEAVESIKGGLRGLVIAEVLTCEKHENSDHLSVTTVSLGEGEPLQVVCGASNVRAGEKVILATVGTTLWSGDESFMIKKSKIRGVESFGMLCAEDEIGVGASHDGIILLPGDAVVGMSARDYYGVEDDYLIEVDITPNRSDAISHYGVARDIAAWCNAHGVEYKLERPSVEEFVAEGGGREIGVEVMDGALCPRYSGLTIEGIKVEESPKWLRDALSTIGLKPINNVVDITNYVQHAIGQPLHAFDADEVKGGKIVVRRAEDGEKFVTLDGEERKLSGDDLMICNEEEPMCIAGVFGGEKSGVTDKTTSVFLESAYFQAVSVRKTARRHGLSTDASFRYERGADVNITIYALKYAAMLIEELAGGKVSSKVTDVYPDVIEDVRVELSMDKARRLIGKALTRDEIVRIVDGLEMKIEKEDGDMLTLRVPAYRCDVERDVDVIEDILRIYGYNNIELSDSLKSNISYSNVIDNHGYTELISEQLTAQGFNEILNNSLTKGGYYEDNGVWEEDKCVRVMNSLSGDLNVMRRTLLYGGLESLVRNINRQHGNLRMYEFGNCYEMNLDYDGDDRVKAFKEEERLGLWVTGLKHGLSWTGAGEKSSFYELKAYVENILVRLGVDLRSLKLSEEGNEIYSQVLVMKNKGGKVIATIGILSRGLLKKMDIGQEVFYADLAWGALIKGASKRKIEYKEISKFPEVKRDLALLVDKGVEFKEIERVAFDTEKRLLKKVVLFDVYEGKNLEDGKKSYAVNFTLRDEEKTLTDKQIDGIMQKLIKQLSDKLGAKLR